MSVGVGETSDHVDGYVHPWPFWDCVQMKWSHFCLGARLRSLASFTAFNVGLNVLLHLWPPEFAEYQLLHLLDSWMTGTDVVMASGNDLAS